MTERQADMAGDAHGAETQEEPKAPQDNRQQQTAQEQPQVSGTDWEKAIAERDGRIAELEQQVADAAKNAETAEQLLTSLRTVTSAMDEHQVSTGSCYLFITPTLNGAIQDFSYANPNRSNRVLERFARVVEVPQVRFYSAIDLLSGDDDQFGYQKASGSYVETTDTEVDSSKTYYTKSGDEYTAVASPTTTTSSRTRARTRTSTSWWWRRARSSSSTSTWPRACSRRTSWSPSTPT